MSHETLRLGNLIHGEGGRKMSRGESQLHTKTLSTIPQNIRMLLISLFCSGVA